jgi:hypothetical protein
VDIHKPKAAHSLGEFAREMAAVILGILIALSLEQAVEAAHWAHAVRDSEASLKEEIATQAEFYALRLATHDCIDRRIDLLEGVVGRVRSGAHEAPLGPISFPQGALIRRDAWEAMSTGAVLPHLEPNRLKTYSLIYAQGLDERVWETSEGEAWDTIRLAEGDPNRLAPQDLSQLRIALSKARRLNFLIAINAKDQLERIESLGVAAPKPADPTQQRECKAISRS